MNTGVMTTPYEVLPAFLSVSNQFQGILLDAYGVFWGGNDFGPLPGSKEVMEKLVANGKIVGILSNSPQLAGSWINKLERNGLLQGKHFHFVLTSGEVARDVFLNEKLPFATPNKKFWVFFGAHPKFALDERLFKDTAYTETKNIDEADFIFIATPHIDGEDQTDPERFREAVEKIKEKNLPMVCPNPDCFAYEGKPPKAVVRQGSIALLYEKLGGRVFYIGKPYTSVYSKALEIFKKYNVKDLEQILMVGDSPETDIQGARAFGMPSALIVKTGIMGGRLESRGVRALEELPSEEIPNYFVERFTDDVHIAS